MYCPTQIRKDGPRLEPLHPAVVVVSPFLRCLQTARDVLGSWEHRPENLRVVIDTQLSEVYNPMLLHSSVSMHS